MGYLSNTFRPPIIGLLCDCLNSLPNPLQTSLLDLQLKTVFTFFLESSIYERPPIYYKTSYSHSVVTGNFSQSLASHGVFPQQSETLCVTKQSVFDRAWHDFFSLEGVGPLETVDEIE